MSILTLASGIRNLKAIFGRKASSPATQRGGSRGFEWKRAPIASIAIIALWIVLAISANFIAPHDPAQTSLSHRLIPPFWMTGGSFTYPLGTDSVGRDVLSRIIYGARVSIGVAAITLILCASVGASLGMVSGYLGGKTDAAIMRLTDTFMAFPVILIASILVVTLGPSLKNVVLAIACVLWAPFARIIRGEVLSLKQRDFIAQARVIGSSPSRILVKHLFPNVLNTLMVLISLQVGWVIIIEASLSFLGAGVPSTTPAWGSMVADGKEYLVNAWWLSLFPGIAITLTVFAFNFFGDWLRDTLDPKLRQV